MRDVRSRARYRARHRRQGLRESDSAADEQRSHARPPRQSVCSEADRGCARKGLSRRKTHDARRRRQGRDERIRGRGDRRTLIQGNSPPGPPHPPTEGTFLTRFSHDTSKALVFWPGTWQHAQLDSRLSRPRLLMQRTRYPERRRTVRLSLQVPLTVRCRLPEGETIDLKASTYIVSAHGALLLMDTPLIPGQNVQVINEMTSELVECYVTYLREKRERRFVGIGFATARADFWHIVFPKSGTRQAIRSAQTGALVPPGFRQDNSRQF